MLCLRNPLPVIPSRSKTINISKSSRSSFVVVCAQKGPRPRYPRVWKATKKIGTISNAAKLVNCIKGLSNVKEEVYGALDSFIAWELEFPLVTVKKALKTLEHEQEWKRIIQVTKWMLSKGQGRTMGTYFMLINALAEDERLDEAEELWTKLFLQKLESMPRMFFDKMISVYYKREMHEKMFEVFADMEELGIRPNVAVVNMMGNVFQKLGMLDKYCKLVKKYPPPEWEYRYIKGKRVRIRAQQSNKFHGAGKLVSGDKKTQSGDEETPSDSNELGDEGIRGKHSNESQSCDKHLNGDEPPQDSNDLNKEANAKSNEDDEESGISVSCQSLSSLSGS